MSIESGPQDEDEWLNGKIFETGLFNGGDGSISGMWLGYQGERECFKSSNVWVFVQLIVSQC